MVKYREQKSFEKAAIYLSLLHAKDIIRTFLESQMPDLPAMP